MRSVWKQSVLILSVVAFALVLFFMLSVDERKLALVLGLAGGLVWGMNMFVTHLVYHGMFGFVKGYGDVLLSLKASVYPGSEFWGIKILPRYKKKENSVKMALILALYSTFDIGVLIFLTTTIAQLLFRFF